MGRMRLIALAIITFTLLLAFIVLPSHAQQKQQQAKQPAPKKPGSKKPSPQQPKPQQSTPKKPSPQKPKQLKPQQPKIKQPKPQQPKPQQPKPQQPKPQQPKPQQPKPQQPKPQQPKPQQPKPQQPKPQQPKPQQPKPQQPKPQQPKPQQPKPQQPKPQQPKPQDPIIKQPSQQQPNTRPKGPRKRAQPAGAQPLPTQPAPQQPAQPQPEQQDGLSLGFYAKTCPKAETIVADVVKSFQQKDPKLPPALIRLLFHDCWVKGCDASVLLDTTSSGQPVEKMSDRNGKTLRGLEVIDEIKAQLEKECPKTVSCADILAFAARDAVTLAGLPSYDVVAGRRDSMTSRATDADMNLPTVRDDMKRLTGMFQMRGFSLEDMVVLSGAHSIGAAQCSQVRDRLYTFAPNVARDPSIDPAYATDLSVKCPAIPPPPGPELFMIDLDPVTPLKLDNQYYTNLKSKKGLLQSDQVLATDPGTAEFVNQMAADDALWSKKFVSAMERMGRLLVLTGDDGQVRLNCRAVNK